MLKPFELSLSSKLGITLRETYVRVGKRLAWIFSRYAHAKQMRGAIRELKKLKTIVGRVLRQFERWLETNTRFKAMAKELLDKADRILSQERRDSKKIYSQHAPDS